MGKNQDNLIFGRNPVKEAIRNNSVLSIILSENFRDADVLKLIKDSSLPVKRVHQNELNQLCPGVNQGIAAYIKSYEYPQNSESLSDSESDSNSIDDELELYDYQNDKEYLY